MRLRANRAIAALLTAALLTGGASGCRDRAEPQPPIPVQHGDPGDPSSYPLPFVSSGG